jgi:hypothetical protein
MQVSRQDVIDFLRGLGYPDIADEAERDLPDPVELRRAQEFGERLWLRLPKVRACSGMAHDD